MILFIEGINLNDAANISPSKGIVSLYEMFFRSRKNIKIKHKVTKINSINILGYCLNAFCL